MNKLTIEETDLALVLAWSLVGLLQKSEHAVEHRII
jgi:hypothetical protein